jgi:hypothetical protein
MKSRISDETRQKRGLGQGEGANYKPFIRPRDFSSRGCTTRIFSHKLNREVVVLSNIELDFFSIIDFADGVNDIKEQYPLLPLTETQAIAEELNIDHPNDGDVDRVMTLDFLVTHEKNGKLQQIGCDIKPSTGIGQREIEKLQITKEFLTRKGIDWCVVTPKQLDSIKLNNIKFIREYYALKSEQTETVLAEFLLQCHNPNMLLRDFITDASRKMRIQFGDCCRIFYHLLATKRIWFDLNRSLNLDNSLNNFKPYTYETNN